ncbi:hypothetical protein C6A85_95935, partial [Mycobacterium sp. ITM-2017-0098]
GSAWAGLTKQQDVLVGAWDDGDFIQVTARVLAMVAIVIPVAGVLYMLGRLARRSVAGAWKGTAGKPAMRLLAATAGVAVMGGIAYAWWPHEANYRPIQPWERGTIGDIVYALQSDRMSAPVRRVSDVDPVASTRMVAGDEGAMQAVWDTRTPMPTQQKPQLALVLRPVSQSLTTAAGGAAGASSASADGWVFPVDKPLKRGPGDNQVLAINTTNGTAMYEAAFAMVWVTDDSDAMNVNEAQAYASCISCTAVAVAYQVVFVVDNDDADDNVVAPQNLAGALNSDCVNCLTYALARQLFITLDEPLSDNAMRELDGVWREMATFEREIEAGMLSREEIETRLEGYTQQMVEIVRADQPEAVASTAGTSTAPTTTTTSTTATTTSSAPTSSV